MLCDSDLAKAVIDGRVGIEPFDPQLIQPASVDVRLDNRFLRFRGGTRHAFIDPAVEQPELTEDVCCEPYLLQPGEFVLGSTREKVTVADDLCVRLEGKSSLGRLGLMVHSTAGFIDPGFSGTITLELMNLARMPIKLYPGMRVAQLCVLEMSRAATYPYGRAAGNKYQGQDGPVA